MSTKTLQAAREYIEGCKTKAEQFELSDRSLARKFGCSRRAFYKALDGQKAPGLTNEHARTLRQCVKERDRLEAKAPYRSKAQVAKIHGVTEFALNRQLEVMGWVNPLTARKRGAA